MELAATHRVVAYDRAGLGASAASPRPRTSGVIAEELHEALGSAGVSPPFLLIGHSAGGFRGRVIVLSASRPELSGLGTIWTGQHRRWSAAEPTREYVLLPTASYSSNGGVPTHSPRAQRHPATCAPAWSSRELDCQRKKITDASR